MPEGGRIHVGNTLPDVNPDEVLGALDGDTRDYLRILLNAGGTAFRDTKSTATGQTASQDLRETFKRFEPTGRYSVRITRQLAKRRRNISSAIHSFQLLSTALGAKDRQLAALVDSANANFSAFAEEEGSLREALTLFPGTLSQTATTLTDVNSLAKELGPTLQGLLPFAHELPTSLTRQRPSCGRPRRSSRTRSGPSRVTCSPPFATFAPPRTSSRPCTPDLTRAFKVLNKFFNELAYDPPGDAQSYLFWGAWAAHSGTLLSTLEDAHGPMIRGIVLATCNDFQTLSQLVASNPQLGMLTALANFPDDKVLCPPPHIALKGKPVVPPPVDK